MLLIMKGNLFWLLFLLMYTIVTLDASLLTYHLDSFLHILGQLHQVQLLTPDQASDIFQSIDRQWSKIFVAMVDNAIVGMVTLLLEHKFARWGTLAGHIEDLVVDEQQRGKGIAQALLEAALAHAQQAGVYKTILDCSQELVSYYERYGFSAKEVCMKRYG
jgi:glucosamine-phosphate N-acetyltransferase